MNNFKSFRNVIILMICATVSVNISLHALEFPNNVSKELRFGAIVPTTGKCTIAHDTGQFTSDHKNICPSINGQPIHHIIIAPENTLIRVTPSRFTYAGGIFTFTPNGVIVSDTETKTLISGSAAIIDSGPSGRLDMYVGGILNVAAPLSTSSSYEVTLEIDIIENP
jgi:hypothetical protein